MVTFLFTFSVTAENRQVSDTEYRQFTDSIINKLIDAERVTTLIIKDIAVAPTTTSSSGATSGNAAALAAAAAAAAEQAELMNAQYRRQQWLAVAGKVVQFSEQCFITHTTCSRCSESCWWIRVQQATFVDVFSA